MHCMHHFQWFVCCCVYWQAKNACHIVIFIGIRERAIWIRVNEMELVRTSSQPTIGGEKDTNGTKMSGTTAIKKNTINKKLYKILNSFYSRAMLALNKTIRSRHFWCSMWLHALNRMRVRVVRQNAHRFIDFPKYSASTQYKSSFQLANP